MKYPGPRRLSHSADDKSLVDLYNKVEESTQEMIHSEPSAGDPMPDDKTVLKTLGFFNQTVKTLLQDTKTSRKRDQKLAEVTATSALLSTIDTKQASSQITKAHLLSTISAQALTIVEHPTVFLTPAVLKLYVSLQATLANPHSFPLVLRLYRSKPLPQRLDAPPHVAYRAPNPASPSTAVDTQVANTALASAIRYHDLLLCLSIIDESYCTTSFARAKLIRTALLPATGALLMPLAAYTLASRFALLQDAMDQNTATGVAMAGILTYAAAVGTMGYVTLTTSNDQMVRVTWATGMPLWERWIREEERSAVEKIAQAWGFKQRDRWGEEVGVDWDELREWTGVRGMVLDRVSLMEGME